MLRYLGRQFVAMIGLLLAASFLIFGSLFLAPGSPEDVLFGGRSFPPAAREALRARLHLNESFLSQYGHWVTGLLHGNLGLSIPYNEPVATRVGQAVGPTVFLVVYAAVLIIAFGLALGLLSALRPGKVDGAVMLLTSIGVAIPSFVAGIILLALFAVDWRLFPVSGAGSGFGSRLSHLTLPAVALAIWATALLSRVTRASVRAELGQEHVDTARARGLSPAVVIRRHVVRNAMIPISTVAGLQVAGLISGTVIVEQAFNVNGMGQLLVTSVGQKDYATVQAIAVILVGAFVVINTLVDILYSVLDPRVRAGAMNG